VIFFSQSGCFCTVVSGSYWRRAITQNHHYTMYSLELGFAYLCINLCTNQIQMQCLGNVPPFLVNKVPVVVICNSIIPQYRSLKNLGN
jgi:hypothetical protein